jgi:hypothetical protein
MAMRLTLSQRLGTVFAVLLLVTCCGASVWLQVRSSVLQQDGDAAPVARPGGAHRRQLRAHGTRRPEPGRRSRTCSASSWPSTPASRSTCWAWTAASRPRPRRPGTRPKRDRVALDPVRRLLAGRALPMQGDDPRSPAVRKVFSAAPILRRWAVARPATSTWCCSARTATPWSANAGGRQRAAHGAVVDGPGGAAGAAGGAGRVPPHHAAAARAHRRRCALRDRRLAGAQRSAHAGAASAGRRPEIAQLRPGLRRMTQRIAEQWRELTRRTSSAASCSPTSRTTCARRSPRCTATWKRCCSRPTRCPSADRRRYLDDRAGPEPQGRPAGAGAVRAGAARIRRGQAREGKLRRWPTWCRTCSRNSSWRPRRATSAWWPTSCPACRW